MKIRSIRGKFTFVFLSFLVIIEVIQLVVCNVFTEDYYLASKKDVMEQAFEEMNDEDFKEIFQDILDLIQDYEESNNLYFMIANEDKKILYSSKNTGSEKFDMNICNIKKHEKEFSTNPNAHTVLGENSKKWMVLYGTISAVDQDYYLEIWTCSEAEFATILSQINHLLIYAMLVAGLIGLMLSYAISRYFARPIEEIDKVTRNITEQNFVTIKQPLRKDELGTLAGNVNKMSEQLKSDVTELKMTNAKLENALEEKKKLQQVRQEFLSNVSHELKTPLAIISGYVDMLVTEGEEIDREYYSKVIQDEVSRMNELIVYLLHVSNMEHITKEMAKQKLDWTAIFLEFIKEREILFESKQIDFSYEVEKDCYIYGNEEYLLQAMGNYVMNAIKYVTENGRIIVSLKKEDDMICYRVYNDGEKIAIDEIEKIWDSFYKVDKARTMDGNNVGLGLHIVKTIVEAHGGNYEVKNKENGVEFSFCIPKYSNEISQSSHNSFVE